MSCFDVVKKGLRVLKKVPWNLLEENLLEEPFSLISFKMHHVFRNMLGESYR